MIYLPPPADFSNNLLEQLLKLGSQLHACSDEVLRSQMQQMSCAKSEESLRSVRLLLHTSQYLRQQLTVVSDVVAPTPTQEKEQLISLLSSREREVLALLALGYTLPRIGEKLFISPATVNNHCARMREKLGLRGRNALTMYAISLLAI